MTTAQRILLAACAAFIFSAPAHAEQLTEASIQAFLDETTKLTHADNGMNDAQIAEYLNEHLDRGGSFSSKIMYYAPGQDVQIRNVTLNKTDFIKNILDGRKSTQDYTSSVTLTSADIKGNKATIKTETTESGRAPLSDNTLVAFDGKSSCNQILKENGGTIIMTSAACETIITFKPQ